MILKQTRTIQKIHCGFIDDVNDPKTRGVIVGTSEEIRQDCIVIPIWKDASYFDSPSKDVDNGEPKFVADDQKQDGDAPNNENDEQDKSDDVSSTKEVNVVGQNVNTASSDVTTSSSRPNNVDPSVNTTGSNDQDSLKYMFT
ncbi:hypothetical protein Tco_0239405, partial [Tanacetum coccineum]